MSERSAAIIARTDSALSKLESAEIALMNRSLDRSYSELERQLLKRYPNYTADKQPNLLATQRALLLLQDLKDQLSLISPDRASEIETRYQQLLATASQEGITLSEELMRLNGGDEFIQATANVPIETVAAAARDSVGRLRKHDEKFREEASIIIQQGLIQGQGAMKVAQGLRGRLGVTKGRAETIARTEIISAQDTAARQNYKRNGIEYVQRIATQDGRVCGYCADRAGKVYPIDEAPAALHPRDRCFNQPFKPEWEQLGLIDTVWIQEHSAAVKAQVEERGEKVLSGPAPFERLNNAKPPKPIWTPQKGYSSEVGQQ